MHLYFHLFQEVQEFDFVLLKHMDNSIEEFDFFLLAMYTILLVFLPLVTIATCIMQSLETVNEYVNKNWLF